MGEYICPHCKRPIYDDDALLCLYCGESLKRGIGVMGRMKYPSRKTIVTLVIFAALLAFVIFIAKASQGM